MHMYGEVSEGIWITNGSMVTPCEFATSNVTLQKTLFHVNSGSKLRVLLPLTIFDCYYTQATLLFLRIKCFFGVGCFDTLILMKVFTRLPGKTHGRRWTDQTVAGRVEIILNKKVTMIVGTTFH